jgi:hypothetical protein
MGLSAGATQDTIDLSDPIDEIDTQNGLRITTSGTDASSMYDFGGGADLPTITNATATDPNDDGVVEDGQTVTVTADVTDEDGIESVTADTSDFGRPSDLSLTVKGEDTYEESFTVDTDTSPGEGSYAITITATDNNGISATADTNELKLETGEKTVLEQYDTNGNNQIDDLEVLAAIKDWREGNLGDLEVLKVIKYWRTQETF